LARSAESKAFYAWIIVAASFLAMSVHGLFFSFGVFYKPLMEHFGWTATQVALAPSTMSIVYILSVLPVSFIYKRSNIRLMSLLGGLLMGSGLILSSQATSSWHLYVSYGIVTGVGTSTVWVPFTSTIVRWFTKRRGLAMGIALSGSGFGSLCAAPLLTYLILTHGWKSAFLLAGLLTLLIMLLAAILMRDSPEGLGIGPHGERETTESQASVAATSPSPGMGPLSIPQILRRGDFWLIYSLWALSTIVKSIYEQHMVLFATTIGISSIIASITLGTIGLSSIIGRLAIGVLQDKIGTRRALNLCYILNLASPIILLSAKNEPSLYLFALIFGFSLGGRTTLEAPMATVFFGVANLATVLAIFETAFGVGGFIGPYLAGHVFDLTGQYSQLFLCCIALSLVLSLIAALLKPKA